MRLKKAGILSLAVLAVACNDSGGPTPETPADAGDALLSQSESEGVNGVGQDRIFGVDADNYLIVFGSDRPGVVRRRVKISGTGGQKIVGIDFRASAVAPADPSRIGKLYGITKTKVYLLNPATGEARNGQTLSVPLAGSFFGTGFNPVVDRLRDHSNADQNLRLNVDDGLTTQDPNLAYASGDPNFGKDPSVAGTGYTNSDNDPNTLTELYAIDARQDALVELINPNDGLLSTVGRLGVRTTNYVGFDIPGTQDAGQRFAYASLTSPDGDGSSTLYRVNLDSGAALEIGEIGNAAPLAGIAIAP